MRHSLPYPFRIKTRFKLSREVIITSLVLTMVVGMTGYSMVRAADQSCPGDPITVPGATKKLISLTGGSRPGTCIKPDALFLNVTNGGTLDDYWNKFNTGYAGTGVAAQFLIDKDGTIVQTMELYSDKTEQAKSDDPYSDRSIGVDLIGNLTFADKSAVPTAQYTAAISLFKFLMQQYSIPIGTQDEKWTACSSTDPLATGVHAHYQACTPGSTDPGQTMFGQFRTDLQAAAAASSTPNTGSTSSGSGGGRWVPYDAYARPYSWPVSGTILQNYGFTDMAQNLGMRYPDLYPKGDPGVIFSTTNHTEPPPNPTVDKYINPNIDITPRSNDTLGRAVYSTQAGWITYADWAGEGKGYTIQIESDVDGDGQADLATRYMRLQAPTVGKDGAYFAPDIAVFHPGSGSTVETTNGECTDPADTDWAPVNKWDSQVQQGIQEINTVEKVSVPCNLVKAFMKVESGGVEAPPNVSGYMGLMQVGDGSAAGGGSNCDWQKYNVHTTQGNINCGVQEIARDYKSCTNSYDGAILKYFTGSCTGGNGGPDAFGTTPQQYLASVKNNWDYLNSQQAKASPPNVPSPSSTTSPGTSTGQVAPPLPAPYILEAEAMDHDSSADLIHDTAASGGLAYRLHSNGALTKTLNQKADQIVVRAKGDQCGGAPTMVLKMDGQEFKRFDVSATDWTDYTATAPFNGAQHQYSIEYINDFQVLSGLVCDRNLYVDNSKFVVTNPNTATTQTLSEQKIEAESLKKRTTTGNTLPAVEDDPLASAGKYVHMVDNSTISDTVTIEKGNWIIVRAKGTSCEGAPHMVVKLDNQVALETDVSSETWMDYSTLLNLSAGTTAPATSSSTSPTTTPTPSATPTSAAGTSAPDTDSTAGSQNQHVLMITFNNDKYVSPWCDRNLDVDVITIQDNSVSQTTNNANSLIGKTKYVGFNQLIGYVSDGRDHEKQGIDMTKVPNANQTYLSYRIMYNNPNFTTFPSPDQPDAFINARVDNPYIVETADNTVAGSLKVAWDHLNDPMWFFCALRTTGNSVKCVDSPNPY